ncbi:ThiF family adenylyltransferase [Acidocella sp.]|uniref:ThiF family adenylyltransferase n=1 Tax=Acidocella sp. TaxID=50710 RepID=UPI003D0620B8
MTGLLHPFASELGAPIAANALRDDRAAALADYLINAPDGDATFIDTRQTEKFDAVIFQIRTYPPQDRAADIHHVEEVAAIFTERHCHPVLFALRGNFPHIAHCNPVGAQLPVAPCIDDRPWADAALTWTPYSYIARVRWWFAMAAEGGLTGAGQVVDPVFLPLGPDLLIARKLLMSLNSAKSYALVFLKNDVAPKALRLVEADDPTAHSSHPFRVFFVALPPRSPGALQDVPRTLSEFLDLGGLGDNGFLPSIGKFISQCDAAALTCRLAILLHCPVQGIEGLRRDDFLALTSSSSIGEIGTALGILQPMPDGIRVWGKVLSPMLALDPNFATLPLIGLDVSLDYDQELSRVSCGIEDGAALPVTLLGAGALGSHLATILVKEGAHEFRAVIDEDWLRPHNVARHALSPGEIGQSKAPALARELGKYQCVHPDSIIADVVGSVEDRDAVKAALEKSEIAIDATASVAVGRELAALNVRQRCVSIFLNPRGDSVVMLMEDADRSIPLSVLEAQYYRLILHEPALQAHLAVDSSGIRHSAACRGASAKIPESRIAALTGIVATGVATGLRKPDAAVNVWTLSNDGSSRCDIIVPTGVVDKHFGEWSVSVDRALLEQLAIRRRDHLPCETGGVLIGIVDVPRRQIFVVDALPAPPDSVSSRNGFERGVVGVADKLAEIGSRTHGMVRYLGEWHTHPARSSSLPSSVDFDQLISLHTQLTREQLPATMLIFADGEFSIAQLVFEGDVA